MLGEERLLSPRTAQRQNVLRCRYVKSKKDGQPRLVYEARKLRKFENGAFWIWDRDSDSWIECFACRCA